uniref:Uncharacterized protein n=1 Tax=Cacopsylla melanoneura TaxID=428564 RepID=A0A8D9AQG9_9HEMI
MEVDRNSWTRLRSEDASLLTAHSYSTCARRQASRPCTMPTKRTPASSVVIAPPPPPPPKLLLRLSCFRKIVATGFVPNAVGVSIGMRTVRVNNNNNNKTRSESPLTQE